MLWLDINNLFNRTFPLVYMFTISVVTKWEEIGKFKAKGRQSRSKTEYNKTYCVEKEDSSLYY